GAGKTRSERDHARSNSRAILECALRGDGARVLMLEIDLEGADYFTSRKTIVLLEVTEPQPRIAHRASRIAHRASRIAHALFDADFCEHALADEWDGRRAVREQRVVELSEIELRPELLLRLVA